MAFGFFDPGEVAFLRGDEGERVARKSMFSGTEYTCEECGLYTHCKHAKIPIQGNGPILILADYPTLGEDATGIPLSTNMGLIVRDELNDIPALKNQIAYGFALRCKPIGEPKPKHIEACRRFLIADIQRLQPKVIIPVGDVAFRMLVGHKLIGRADSTYTNWVGECIPDQEYKCWICPIYHPRDIGYMVSKSKNPDDTAEVKLWIKQLKRATRYINEPFIDFQTPVQESIKIVTTITDAIQAIKYYQTKKRIACDWETTGIKAQRKEQRILAFSISDGITSTAFPMFQSKEFVDVLVDFLEDANVEKIAHNAAFEYIWAAEKLNCTPRGFKHDTALLLHLLHNQKPVSLKWGVYAQYGVAGYDSLIDAYIEADKSEKELWGANALNHLEEAPQLELLSYNAQDSLFTYWLYEDLIDRLPKAMRPLYTLFNEGQIELSRSHLYGMHTEQSIIKDRILQVEELLQNALDAVRQAPEILQHWVHTEEFDPNKLEHVKEILFDKLGYVPYFFTDTEQPKTDIKSLEALNTPIAKKILEYRRWYKVLNTYLAGFAREELNGRIHGFFTLNRVRTYRSSANTPNFQNIPSRDREIKSLVRSLIYPTKGHFLAGDDYKSVEVIVAAVYTQDDNLLRYVQDKGTDMHRDSAMDILLLTEEQVKTWKKGDWRKIAKNKFVFPEFYGSYYGNIAPDFWDEISVDVQMLEHLQSKGIRNFDDFEEHLHEVENVFWNERFYGYKQWKQDMFAFYNKHGYIESYTGARFQPPMDSKQVSNYPIQSSAAHILFWTYVQVGEEIRKRNLHSRLIGQIHDQVLKDTHPNERDIMNYLVWEYGTQKVRDHWKWINVPLEIESEEGEVDQPWSTITAKGFLHELVSEDIIQKERNHARRIIQ